MTVPLLVVRLIGPVTAVAGTVEVTEPKEGAWKVATELLNLMEDSPSLRFAPVITTEVPIGPATGEKL